VPERFSQHYEQLGIDSPLAEFYGMVENIDENFGLLLRRLDELDLADDTIVIFMTDNGSAMGGRAFNAGMRGAKGSEYEGGHRVPFFIRWAGGGISGGRDIDQLAAHVDVLPTLAELAGVQLPRELELDGSSLVPLLREGVGAWSDRILITDSQRVDQPVKWRKSAVMQDRWRLINGEELYDLRTDPSQTADNSREHPGKVARLRQAYEDWWAGLEPSLSRYARIVLGSERKNLHGSRLTTSTARSRGCSHRYKRASTAMGIGRSMWTKRGCTRSGCAAGLLKLTVRLVKSGPPAEQMPRRSPDRSLRRFPGPG